MVMEFFGVYSASSIKPCYVKNEEPFHPWLLTEQWRGVSFWLGRPSDKEYDDE